MSSTGRAIPHSLISPLTAAVVTLALLGALLAGAGNAFHQPVHDLDTDLADLTVLGANGSDQLGWIVASGDFNGDSIDDFLITARLADPLGRGNAGAAYVIFGPRSGTIDLYQCPTDPSQCANVVIQGADVDDQLGFSAAVGNFDGDAYDDILVASWNADGLGTGACVNAGGDPRGTGGRCSAGEVYVVLGSSSLPDTVDTQAGEQDFTVYGAAIDDQVGVSSAAGDVDNDGYDDILLGSTSADPDGRSDAGEAYVVFGRQNLSGSVDLATSPDIVTVQGDMPGDKLGGSVGAGDFNGNGVADLLLGAHFAAPEGRAAAGVVYGLVNPSPGTIDLHDPGTTADLTVLGAEAGDVVGLRASGGDFDGDGQDDLYLDARLGDGKNNAHVDAGEAYVILGPNSGEIDLYNTDPHFTIFGGDADGRLRASLDAGDFNGDGIDDLATSAFWADADNGARADAGEAYVVFGRDPLSGSLDLAAAAADRTVMGAQAGDNLGRWLSAGDFNGIGGDDLLMGAIGADPGGRTNAGEAYVLFSGDPPNTRADSNVCVALNGGLGVVEGVRVCFSSVSTAGDTTLVTGIGGSPPPTGLRIVGTGGKPLYYDFNTTATYSPPVTICIHYDETQVRGPEANLKLRHRVGTGWTDITTSIDEVNDIICGTTTTLSPFAIMEPSELGSPPVGGVVELATGPSDLPDGQRSGQGHERDVPALAVALAAVGVAGVSWHRFRRRVG